MTAQDYLEQYSEIKRDIKRLMEERQRWEDLALKITPNYSDTPVSGSAGAGKIQTAIEQIEEWESELDRMISEQLKLRKEIEATISKVKTKEYQTLLRLRYINGFTWERVSEEMHYGYQWTHKLHRRALEEMQEAMESDYHSMV